MNSSSTTPSAPERPRLLVLRGDDLPPGHERIDDHPGLGEVVYTTADELSARLPGADALLVWDLFTEALSSAWPKADSLGWVHAATTGVDNLMFPGLVESGVVVTNSRGVFDEHIAEYVLGQVVSFAKDFHRSWDYQRERQWKHRETERVAGARALVVGTGPIGRAIARKLRAVGMDVRGSGSHARDGDPDFGHVAESSLAERADNGGRTLRGELPEADYVVIAAPLTQATQGLVDQSFLDLMKPTARLVNVAAAPSSSSPTWSTPWTGARSPERHWTSSNGNRSRPSARCGACPDPSSRRTCPVTWSVGATTWWSCSWTTSPATWTGGNCATSWTRAGATYPADPSRDLGG